MKSITNHYNQLNATKDSKRRRLLQTIHLRHLSLSLSFSVSLSLCIPVLSLIPCRCLPASAYLVGVVCLCWRVTWAPFVSVQLLGPSDVGSLCGSTDRRVNKICWRFFPPQSIVSID